MSQHLEDLIRDTSSEDESTQFPTISLAEVFSHLANLIQFAFALKERLLEHELCEYAADRPAIDRRRVLRCTEKKFRRSAKRSPLVNSKNGNGKHSAHDDDIEITDTKG
jgi:hypothetical protein